MLSASQIVYFVLLVIAIWLCFHGKDLVTEIADAYVDDQGNYKSN